MTQLIDLTEHMAIMEDAAALRAAVPHIDDSEYYDIDYDDETQNTTVTLYDADGKSLGSVVMGDFDSAVASLEDLFDLDNLEDYDYPTEK